MAMSLWEAGWPSGWPWREGRVPVQRRCGVEHVSSSLGIVAHSQLWSGPAPLQRVSGGFGCISRGCVVSWRVVGPYRFDRCRSNRACEAVARPNCPASVSCLSLLHPRPQSTFAAEAFLQHNFCHCCRRRLTGLRRSLSLVGWKRGPRPFKAWFQGRLVVAGRLFISHAPPVASRQSPVVIAGSPAFALHRCCTFRHTRPFTLTTWAPRLHLAEPIAPVSLIDGLAGILGPVRRALHSILHSPSFACRAPRPCPLQPKPHASSPPVRRRSST